MRDAALVADAFVPARRHFASMSMLQLFELQRQ